MGSLHIYIWFKLLDPVGTNDFVLKSWHNSSGVKYSSPVMEASRHVSYLQHFGHKMNYTITSTHTLDAAKEEQQEDHISETVVVEITFNCKSRVCACNLKMSECCTTYPALTLRCIPVGTPEMWIEKWSMVGLSGRSRGGKFSVRLHGCYIYTMI